MRENLYQLFIGLILSLIALSMVFPFIYVLAVSLTDASAYNGNSLNFWPKDWSLEAYKIIFTGEGFMDALKSTVFITGIGTPLVVVVSCMFAYMLSKKTLPARKMMLTLITFTLLFSPGLIPNYLLIKNLGLLDSLWAVILVGSANAWTILVMKSFFQSIPAELEESAKIDGCSDLGVFFKIILPLSKPMLAAFSLFTAVGYWNTYFNAIIYITDPSKWPLQVFLQQVVISSNIGEFLSTGIQEVQQKVPVPTEVLQMAAVVVVTLPVIIVYPFLQKHFAKGVMIGSVKG
ncbi:carbohydrate ABC transporter permease [Mesobacillus foraminis]|nr:carbohydrate ABC transporter permease [Mesobacillus foraminis]